MSLAATYLQRLIACGVILIAGGATGLSLAWIWMPPSRVAIQRAGIALAVGVALALVYRYAVGVRPPSSGSYSGKLFGLQPLSAMRDALRIYLFVASDVFLVPQ